MRKKLQDFMFEASYIFELIISIIVATAIVFFAAKMFFELFQTFFSNGDVKNLVSILDNAISLAIGAELIKMLCKHTPETVIEVLAFALAKQLIVGHARPWENLIMVAAIAVLFGIRKFLLKRYDMVETPDGLLGLDTKKGKSE